MFILKLILYTFIGVILAANLPLGIIGIIVWAIVLAVTRYVSLASLVMAGVTTLLSLWLGIGLFVPMLLMTVLLAYRHQENIERLRAGTEPKFDMKW